MTFVYDCKRYKDEPRVFELVVMADTNDADYVTLSTDISLLEIEEIVKPALELIKSNGCKVPFHECSKEWPSSFKEEQELIEIFREFYCPYGEYGIHTIKSVKYYPTPEKVTLL